MWPNPQETADMVTITDGKHLLNGTHLLNGKLIFCCSEGYTEGSFLVAPNIVLDYDFE